MGFSNNYSKASMDSFDNKPEGDYEVIVKGIKEKTFKTNTVGLNVKMVIRNDIEQPCKNSYLFHTFWKRKNPSEADKQVKGYSFNQIMCFAQAASLPEGKEYESLEQLCEDIINKPMIAAMRYEGEYNGKPQERIIDFYKTEHKDVKHKDKNAVDVKPDEFAAPARGGIAVPSSTGNMVDDSDLPF